MNIKEIEKFSPSSLLYIFVTILMILTLTIRVYLFIYSFNTDSNYISMQQALGVSVGDGENKSPVPGDGEIPTLAPTQVIPPVKTPEPLPTSIQTTPQPNPTNAPFPTPTSSPVVVTPSPGDDLWILPVPGPGKPEPPITAPINLNDPNMQLQVERKNNSTTVKAYKNAGTAAAKDSLSTQEYTLPRTSLGTINKWLSFYAITVTEAAGADGLLMTRSGVTAYTDMIVELNINSTSAQICTSEQSCVPVYYPDTIAAYADDLNLITSLEVQETTQAALTLTQNQGTLSYEISGCSQQYLLALVPYCIPRSVCIDAANRSLCGISQTRINEFLDFIAI